MVWYVALVAVALGVIGLSLATDGPTVHTVSQGDYTCYAPYDIVLNDQGPTGMPVDYGEVLMACRGAGEHRFHLAVGFGMAAGVATLLAMAAAWRSWRRVSAELSRLPHTNA